MILLKLFVAMPVNMPPGTFPCVVLIGIDKTTGYAGGL
jgi:hypothetical protein